MEPVTMEALRFSYTLQSLITAVKKAGGDPTPAFIDDCFKMSLLEFLRTVLVPNYIRFEYIGPDRILDARVQAMFSEIAGATDYLKQKKGQ